MLDIDDTLRKYADLTIRVGLNLQRGQRLAIIGPLANGGVSLTQPRWFDASRRPRIAPEPATSRPSGVTRRCNWRG